MSQLHGTEKSRGGKSNYFVSHLIEILEIILHIFGLSELALPTIKIFSVIEMDVKQVFENLEKLCPLHSDSEV